MSEPLSHAPDHSVEKPVLLLIDDDPLISESLGFILKKNYQVHIAESRIQARAVLAALDQVPQLALVDLGLPPSPHSPDEGFALIEDLLAHDPQMKIMVLSGQSEEANIQHALTLGAVDFIPKPAEPALLQTRLQHQLMLQQVEKKQEQKNTDAAIIGESASMQVLRQQIDQFSNSIFPVLIEGESGTGKELIAKALHQQSSRSQQPYMVINCAAIAPELLEAQLFGHTKGAFTGATREHKGFFQQAGEGTLFLDEIGEIAYDLQAKLLRVLESGEYYRVGDTQCLTSKARIIAATNKTLADEVRASAFRSDLFHRLSILKIQVPGLRDRGRDSLLLFDHFRKFYAESILSVELDESARELWVNYGFPGNVRELRNIVIRLGTKYPGAMVSRKQLQAELELDAFVSSDAVNEQKNTSNILSDEVLKQQMQAGEVYLDQAIRDLENHYIELAMEIYDGNLSKVAKALHVNRTTLYSRMQKK
ncbi:MAG: sigma-54 dependent transcriptional regulator [Gammaproteobacteria bacterium]|nr:sigma-54 dependent transcriptional regulator [Gammaproteobacteria bacterium]